MRDQIQRAFEPVTADEGLRAKVMETMTMAQAKQRPRSAVLRPALALGCLLVAVLGFGGVQLWRTPVSFISVDINPSIELSLNTFDRVVAAQALNGDAEVILEQVSLTGQSYAEAIDQLLEAEALGSYLSQDSLLSFTVISDREEELILGIEASDLGQYRYSCGSADRESISEAHHYGLSFGKYRMYQDVAQYDESFTPEECHGMTMGELADRAEVCRREAEGGGHGNGNGNGNGNGAGNGNGTGHHGGHGHGT